jgi:hypothetical protein
MDPNAAVAEMVSALQHGDREEARQRAINLVNWQREGGFAPACGWDGVAWLGLQALLLPEETDR